MQLALWRPWPLVHHSTEMICRVFNVCSALFFVGVWILGFYFRLFRCLSFTPVDEGQGLSVIEVFWACGGSQCVFLSVMISAVPLTDGTVFMWGARQGFSSV